MTWKNQNLVYIGSTINSLKGRWKGHKDAYKQYLKKIVINVTLYLKAY